MVYIVFFIVLFLFACVHERWDNLLFKIASFALLVLVCLRSQTIGIDTTYGYRYYFQYIQEGLNLNWLEPLWIFINKLSIWFGLGYQGVLIFAGLFTLLPVFYVISKTCNNKRFALAIYYGLYLCLFSFNIMRQCVAISFILLAAYLYIAKKYRTALLSFIVATMFHSSAFIALPLVLFFKLNVDFKKIILLFIATYFLGIFLNDQFFFTITGSYSKNLLATDGYTGFRSSIVIPAIFCFIFNVFFLIVLFPEYNKLKNDSWLLMVILGVLMMNMTMRMGQGTRIVLYFSQAQAIFIPNHIRKFENERDKLIICFLYSAFLGANFFRMLILSWNEVCPYSFFWLE